MIFLVILVIIIGVKYLSFFTLCMNTCKVSPNWYGEVVVFVTNEKQGNKLRPQDG